MKCFEVVARVEKTYEVEGKSREVAAGKAEARLQRELKLPKGAVVECTVRRIA